MEKYTIGICDDDKAFCTQLENYIELFFKEQSLSVEIYVWYDGESLIADIPKIKPLQILFLDIELRSMTGVEVGHFIREGINDFLLQIIYISSKTVYALKLFETHPFDFIVKPIDYKYLKKILNAIILANGKNIRCYCFKFCGTTFRIPYGEIEYIESNNKHLLLKTTDGKEYKFIGRLKNEKKFFVDGFMSTSKSCIVNIKHITIYRSDYVKLNNGEIKNISKSCRKEARMRFQEYIEGELY